MDDSCGINSSGKKRQRVFSGGGEICRPSFDAGRAESSDTMPPDRRITALRTLARGWETEIASLIPDSICKNLSFPKINMRERDTKIISLNFKAEKN